MKLGESFVGAGANTPDFFHGYVFSASRSSKKEETECSFELGIMDALTLKEQLESWLRLQLIKRI